MAKIIPTFNFSKTEICTLVWEDVNYFNGLTTFEMKLIFAFLGRAGFVDLYQDGVKTNLINEPYFSYDSPKTFT